MCRYSPATLAAGAHSVEIAGRPVKVFNPEKTIVDCFKYRNKIGLDVALDALSTAWRKKRVTMSELEKYARYLPGQPRHASLPRSARGLTHTNEPPEKPGPLSCSLR